MNVHSLQLNSEIWKYFKRKITRARDWGAMTISKWTHLNIYIQATFRFTSLSMRLCWPYLFWIGIELSFDIFWWNVASSTASVCKPYTFLESSQPPCCRGITRGHYYSPFYRSFKISNAKLFPFCRKKFYRINKII